MAVCPGLDGKPSFRDLRLLIRVDCPDLGKRPNAVSAPRAGREELVCWVLWN